MMVTVEQVFEVLGGPVAVGTLLNISTQAASNMKSRRSIPGKYWKAIAEEAKAKGNETVTLEALAELAAGEPNERTCVA